MKVKIHSAELNRMMKTIIQCVDGKHAKFGNINIIYDNNLLTIRATNGQTSAVMSSPVMGGDGESFCVDGGMFAKVCAMCCGEVEISTDGKVCTVKGAGRTRLPIVSAEIPRFERVKGKALEIPAEDFSRSYNAVAYAIGSDVSRMVLTGVFVESDGAEIRMVTLDGFQLSMEKFACSGEVVTAVIPGSFMKLVSQSVTSGEKVNVTIGDARVQAEADGMLMGCGLLIGNYPDYRNILPQAFATECLVKVDELKNALKSSGVIDTGNKLVKLKVEQGQVTVMSNSETADYEAEVACETNGDGLTIAFNQRYLMNTIGSIATEEAVMKFNTPTSPCVVQGKGENGLRLTLPVRVVEG